VEVLQPLQLLRDLPVRQDQQGWQLVVVAVWRGLRRGQVALPQRLLHLPVGPVQPLHAHVAQHLDARLHEPMLRVPARPHLVPRGHDLQDHFGALQRQLFPVPLSRFILLPGERQEGLPEDLQDVQHAHALTERGRWRGGDRERGGRGEGEGKDDVEA